MLLLLPKLHLQVSLLTATTRKTQGGKDNSAICSSKTVETTMTILSVDFAAGKRQVKMKRFFYLGINRTGGRRRQEGKLLGSDGIKWHVISYANTLQA